ncbi:MAG: right-handed parallel beta-helix repeat-containing protein, partial [Chloroflexota bacterium]
GTYAEKVSITGARDGLQLISIKPLKATIKDPSIYAYPMPPIVGITDVDNVTVKGFKVRALTKDTYDAFSQDGIIATNAKSVTIQGNNLGWTGPGGWTELSRGIVATGGTTGTISGNTIFDAATTGIDVVDASNVGTNVTVKGNTIKTPFAGLNSSQPPVLAAWTGWGIEVKNARAIVSGNTLTAQTVYNFNTTLSNAIEVYNGPGSTVSGNTVTGAAVGIKVTGSGHVVSGNTLTTRQTSISLNNADGAVVKNNTAKATYGSFGGIWVSASTGNANIHDNDFRGSTGTDCVDAGGNANTNTWTNDLGNESNPSGICDTIGVPK